MNEEQGTLLHRRAKWLIWEWISIHASIIIVEALQSNLIQELEYRISESEQTSCEVFMPSYTGTWTLIPQEVKRL